MNFESFAGARVFVTGDTGFKGSWLCQWLHSLGAEVIGIGLKPNTSPSLFDELALPEFLVAHHEVDICDLESIRQILNDFQPDYVFHLAAQSLVRESYLNPIETVRSNVLGTATLLSACLESRASPSVVNVTSDKCYQNNEDGVPFREDSPMGGSDPYSASKGAAELISNAYRESFSEAGLGANLANVRAGNVIGGGDWCKDRLLPDAIRALSDRKPLSVRNPDAVRPWQHVLEPLAGYMEIALRLRNGEAVAEGWNFGPTPAGVKTVDDVVRTLSAAWKNLDQDNRLRVESPDSQQPAEARLLTLDITKARTRLNWKPLLSFEQSVQWVAQWYYPFYAGTSNARDLCREQIANYERLRAV